MASALRLFAIAFGPLPGVDAPADHRRVRSASVAVRAIRAYEDELTPDQRTAVAAYLTPPADALTIEVGPVGSATSSPSVALSRGGTPAVALAALTLHPAGVPAAVPGPEVGNAIAMVARNARAAIAARIGSDIPGPIAVVLTGKDDPNYGYGDATWQGDAYAGCTIEITAKATDAEPLVIINVVTHEVFHCFEARDYRKGDWGFAPDWVIEGAAEWAAADIAPDPSGETEWWDTYLTEPATPVSSRSYDAIGFYAHLVETGTSPWSTFRAMFKTGLNSEEAFAASGASNDAFLDSWASGLFRQPARGSAWDTTGVGITDSAASHLTIRIHGDGDSESFSTGAYQNALYDVEAQSHFLEISATGRTRLSDGRVDLPRVTESIFCTDPGGCEPLCPDGTPLSPTPTVLGRSFALAVTGGLDGTAGALHGLTLEDVCRRQTAVWVHIDRPASAGLQAGTVLDLVSCNGPNGTWNGYMALGGIEASGGFTVPFVRLPLSFTVGGKGPQTVKTAVAGSVPTPVFTVKVAYQLSIAVDPGARRMSITGTGSGDTGLFTFTDALGPGASSLQIEPAPAGRCS